MNSNAMQGKTAILAAFRLEVEYLASQLHDSSGLRSKGPLKFVTGKYQNHSILVGTTGIGKVRAAAGTQAAIHIFQPERIIMCGTAGSLSPLVHALDLVVARELLQHDTGPKVPEPVPAAPELCALLEAAAKKAVQGVPHTVHVGTLVTGDRPVIDPAKREALFHQFLAAAVDMEAAAVAAVCVQNQLSMGAVKAITDSADTEVKGDFKKNVKEGAALAQQAVLSLFDE